MENAKDELLKDAVRTAIETELRLRKLAKAFLISLFLNLFCFATILVLLWTR